MSKKNSILLAFLAAAALLFSACQNEIGKVQKDASKGSASLRPLSVIDPSPFINPANNHAVFSLGTPITFSYNPIPDETSEELYVNGVPIYENNGSFGSKTFTPTSVGTYTYFVSMTNSSHIEYHSDLLDFTVMYSFTSPANNNTTISLGSSITFSYNGIPNQMVTVLFVNGTQIYCGNPGGSSGSKTFTPTAPGTYSYYAIMENYDHKNFYTETNVFNVQ